MNLLRSIDDGMFRFVFQPVTNGFGARIQPVELARFCLTGTLVTIVGECALTVYQGTLTGFHAVGALLILLCGTYLYSKLRGFNGSGRNPRRVDPIDFYNRLFFLFQTALVGSLDCIECSMADAIRLIGMLMLVASFYFQACDQPPPPSRVPVKGWAQADG